MQIQRHGYNRLQGHREMERMAIGNTLFSRNRLFNFVPYPQAPRHRGTMNIYSVQRNSALGMVMLF